MHKGKLEGTVRREDREELSIPMIIGKSTIRREDWERYLLLILILNIVTNAKNHNKLNSRYDAENDTGYCKSVTC